MFRVTPLAVAAGAFLALSASFTNAQVGGPAASFNDVARFVAGQATSPGSSLRQLDNLPAVRRHMTDSVAGRIVVSTSSATGPSRRSIPASRARSS
ncbi:MAG: hypothetical protein NWR99_03805 [Verrucomicrobiales bacterium]|nr:hypothetical protein [Verrucomicrobiales bacterium]